MIYDTGPGAPTKNPCFTMYAGTEPFSECESQALANYLNKTKEDIALYLSLHTFSQKWMTPFGHTPQKPERYVELVRYKNIDFSPSKKTSLFCIHRCLMLSLSFVSYLP